MVTFELRFALRLLSSLVGAGALLCGIACSNTPQDGDTSGGGTTANTGGSSAMGGRGEGGSGEGGSGAGAIDGAGGSGGSGGTTTTGVGGATPNLLFEETFDGADGDAWPAPWVDLGGTALFDIRGNAGRFTPEMSNTSYPLSRIGVPVTATDAEVTARVRFETRGRQGFGFYVRQNGGYLTDTTPTGSGYGAFIAGFSHGGVNGTHVGVWREADGDEQMITGTPVTIDNDVFYRMRFQVRQEGAATRLRARVWPDGATEPATWHVDTTDDYAPLQGTAGDFAVDAWVSPGGPAPDLLIDDVRIVSLD